jgi:hypothetical protein
VMVTLPTAHLVLIADHRTSFKSNNKHCAYILEDSLGQFSSLCSRTNNLKCQMCGILNVNKVICSCQANNKATQFKIHWQKVILEVKLWRRAILV